MASPDVFLIGLKSSMPPQVTVPPDVQQRRSIKEHIQSYLKQIIPLLKQLNINDRQLLDTALIRSLDDRRLSGTALISSLEVLISRLEDPEQHNLGGVSLDLHPNLGIVDETHQDAGVQAPALPAPGDLATGRHSSTEFKENTMDENNDQQNTYANHNFAGRGKNSDSQAAAISTIPTSANAVASSQLAAQAQGGVLRGYQRRQSAADSSNSETGFNGQDRRDREEDRLFKSIADTIESTTDAKNENIRAKRRQDHTNLMEEAGAVRLLVPTDISKAASSMDGEKTRKLLKKLEQTEVWAKTLPSNHSAAQNPRNTVPVLLKRLKMYEDFTAAITGCDPLLKGGPGVDPDMELYNKEKFVCAMDPPGIDAFLPAPKSNSWLESTTQQLRVQLVKSGVSSSRIANESLDLQRKLADILPPWWSATEDHASGKQAWQESPDAEKEPGEQAEKLQEADEDSQENIKGAKKSHERSDAQDEEGEETQHLSNEYMLSRERKTGQDKEQVGRRQRQQHPPPQEPGTNREAEEYYTSLTTQQPQSQGGDITTLDTAQNSSLLPDTQILGQKLNSDMFWPTVSRSPTLSPSAFTFSDSSADEAQENPAEPGKHQSHQSKKRNHEPAEGPPGGSHVQDDMGGILQSPSKEPQGPSGEEAGQRNGHAGEQQKESQTSNDPAGAGPIVSPPQPGRSGSDDGSLDLDESADPDVSVEGQEEQEEQEDHGEPAEGRSQQTGKRKHGPTPADSEYKRPRIESSTGQAAVGEVEGGIRFRESGGGEDPNQLSSRLRQRIYPENDHTEGGKSKPQQKKGKVRAEDRQAEDRQAEDRQAEDQAEYVRVEHALTRDTKAGDAKLTEMQKASNIVRSILGNADQSLFSQYIESISNVNTVKGEGDAHEEGTYYQRMATRSLCKLYQTRIPITKSSSTEHIYLTAVQVVDIIREVFANLLPNMFSNLQDSIMESHAMGHEGTTSLLPGQGVPVPEGVFKVQGILHELEQLQSTGRHAKMRQLRLLVQLRTVYNAVIDPSMDISSIETDLQPIIMDVREYTTATRIQSKTTKSKAKAQLTKILFAGDEARLRKYKQKSDVLSVMVGAFSIGCLWMKPKPHVNAWTGITSGVDMIFKIIKECDPDNRVYNICRSLDALTLAYTDAESSIYTDGRRLHGLREDLPHCITWLMGEHSGALPRVVEEYSPLEEEQGGCSSQLAHGDVRIAGTIEGRLDDGQGQDTSSDDAQRPE